MATQDNPPRCPHCGAVVVPGATFCQACGGRVAAEEKPEGARAAGSTPSVRFCVQCGAQLREGARFCPKCGQTVRQSKEASPAT